MSLAALVAFAQEFGPSFEDTRSGEPDGIDIGAEDQLARPRAGVPNWVRQRTPEQEVPVDWKLDGPTDREPEPPDVELLGPDALAFYAPFHFYRNDWGIFVRTSGIKYLAEVLKGRALDIGDEQYLELAESMLLGHEWHHAASEIAARAPNCSCGRPCTVRISNRWKPAGTKRRSPTHPPSCGRWIRHRCSAKGSKIGCAD